ncbi:hypothetical protein HN695_00180 [Candidatus Woesearchaeota archaeon]|jgi:uncharacterized protein|nr:hypothetical protein [Candidatus Woesearchaeota archaeon]MBT5272563.1 hypothetical protein [Candidatus Woesearchaeota archaeon]MBT6040580.1 hypothetical protein [Candidatus Woesearchaeota archaeon]MBT6337115.1 hypothetical protein [Candidatus Woesearchaeota archaeon]MBT7926730.1 hypothetical protein [Candidatus Woesearchaeota archaeon]
MKWNFKLLGKLPTFKRPVLIEGLPGIGNVGKVVVDYLIDDLKAIKLYDISSDHMPHSVFVNEDNLVELPSIEIYYKKAGKKGCKNDLLFLTGDVQPIDEQSCYAFCNQILDLMEKLKCKEIIAMGGIGLQEVGKMPKVYCTGNTKKIVTKYTKKTKASNKIHGVVGPIMGVSGLIVGLASPRDIEAVALLAETIAHPMFVGVKGAREIMKVVEKTLNIKVNIKDIEKEIKSLEKEMVQTTKELMEAGNEVSGSNKTDEVSYIG